ncbi:MAG: hypothetical protein U1E10_19555 [Bdellovibrionales bacterium]|nr:hypothetical protein [Bdellovibrionales bacterium]
MGEFLDHLKERLTNSFWGAFIYAWLIFNWRAVVFLFAGDDGTSKRIENIEAFLSNNPHHYILPLVFALFFVTIGRFIGHLYQAIPRWLEIRRLVADKLAEQYHYELTTYRTHFEAVIVNLNSRINKVSHFAESIKTNSDLADYSAARKDANLLQVELKKIVTDIGHFHTNLESHNFEELYIRFRKSDELATFFGLNTPNTDLFPRRFALSKLARWLKTKIRS